MTTIYLFKGDNDALKIFSTKEKADEYLNYFLTEKCGVAEEQIEEYLNTNHAQYYIQEDEIDPSIEEERVFHKKEQAAEQKAEALTTQWKKDFPNLFSYYSGSSSSSIHSQNSIDDNFQKLDCNFWSSKKADYIDEEEYKHYIAKTKEYKIISKEEAHQLLKEWNG